MKKPTHHLIAEVPRKRAKVPRKITFLSSDKVVEMAKRGEADWTSADRQSLEYAIKQGRGGVWLDLTKAQLEKLR